MKPEEIAALRAGSVAALPQLFGVVPWGIVMGVAMVAAGLTPLQAIAMSLLVFAGVAQLSVLPLLVLHAPLWVAFLTAAAVSLRYVIYSASLAPYFEHLPKRWRVLLSYITVDAMFVIFVSRYPAGSQDPARHWFFLGGSASMWATWQVSSWTGIFAGALIPAEWSLEFAATLGLIALLAPLLLERAVAVGALVAGVVSLVAIGLPLKLGLVVAIVAGVAGGLLFARIFPEKRAASG